MKTILVVEDLGSMRLLLSEYLTEQGFDVATAPDGREAMYIARRDPPDLILLDLMMPNMNGYEFLQRYRKEKTTPVIILTALDGEAEAVKGFDLGADDYVIKPFRMQELTSRIRAVLRRAEGPEPGTRILRAGDLYVDESAHIVKARGERVRLTPMEFALLDILMTAPGRVFTREQLIENLPDRNFVGLASTLSVHIRNLRTKIEDNPDEPRYIETIFGVGYRFRSQEV
jgi:DNA-binding response OmpR family regulator